MYAGRVHRRVDWVTGAIAQLSIVVLGVLIAFVVVALLMPLLSLITSLS
jgi:type II secretory pathway component PulF